jgi:3-hydroxybutyryl-CoA dehydratase
MKVSVGDSATSTKTITDDDIRMFAELSGDHNPVHLDDAYAGTTRFRRRIAHGMLSASLVSSVLANHLPGPGTVYLSQTLKFLAPVYPGDTITARATVIRIREEKGIVTLETTCFNQNEEKVLTGEAVVLLPSD